MRKGFRIFLCAIFILSFTVFIQAQNTETVTISTYYPSPFGVYNNLRLFPIATVPATACDSADEEGTVYYNNDANQNQLMVCRETAPGVFGWQAVGASFWTQGDSNLYPNDITWKVGIGTTTPQRKLHIVDSSSGTPSALSVQNIDTTDGNGACLSFRGVTTNAGVVSDSFSEFAAVRGRFVSHSAAGRVGALDFHVAGPTGSVANPAMTLNGTNRNIGIGIGAGNPRARLEVAGEVKIGSTSLVCDSNAAGALRYNSGEMQYCNGTTWKVVAPYIAGTWGDYFKKSDGSDYTGCFPIPTWGVVQYSLVAGIGTCSCPAGYTSQILFYGHDYDNLLCPSAPKGCYVTYMACIKNT